MALQTRFTRAAYERLENELDTLKGRRLMSLDIGIPQTMGEVGIKAKDIDDLVDGAMKMTRLLVNNPRQVRPEDARAIFEQAL